MAAFSKTSFVAATDHQAFLKNLPRMTPAGPALNGELWTGQGQWKDLDGKYQLAFSGGQGDLAGAVEGDRLTMTGPGAGEGLTFTREN